MATTILITGANRGLGRAAVEKYLPRDNVTVVAAVRDPSHETSKSLATISKGSGSKLIVVQLDSAEFNPTKLKESLTNNGVQSLDTVLASAAIAQAGGPIAQVQLGELQRHIETNAYGVLALFQATVGLLEKSANPKFVVFGSPLGSVGGMERRAVFPMTVYGGSKALVHYFVRRIHFEHPNLTAFVIDPGFVQTDMGNNGAKAAGMEKAFDEVEPTIVETVKLIDESTREAHSGRFIPTGKSSIVELEGKDFPW
ncbi:hypothetical protein PMIN06_011544 [Paraphaeosphaeria minitans]|uniref:Aflatoxin biosynthesis ketoreductase nor-1 n=1 Tax=Paraphaeosphaeria minitans TaxID=565426 RepID=A0A9P6GHI5_9PLEO|nr:aflatoxin biosynthesis ketoreductase nor-1 [Paraphaeosphaeria minitans]